MHIEFPKYVFFADGTARRVETAEQLAAIPAGWRNSPAAFTEPPAVAIPEPEPVVPIFTVVLPYDRRAAIDEAAMAAEDEHAAEALTPKKPRRGKLVVNS